MYKNVLQYIKRGGIILFKDATAITLGVGTVGLHQIYRQTVGKNDDVTETKKEIENGKND